MLQPNIVRDCTIWTTYLKTKLNMIRRDWSDGGSPPVPKSPWPWIAICTPSLHTHTQSGCTTWEGLKILPADCKFLRARLEMISKHSTSQKKEGHRFSQKEVEKNHLLKLCSSSSTQYKRLPILVHFIIRDTSGTNASASPTGKCVMTNH